MMEVKRKISFVSASLAVVSACFPLAANAAEIAMNTAQMQAMDKITGTVSVINIPVGGEVKFGSFSILVRDCRTRSPEETPENFAFVDVADTEEDGTQFNIFKGWMISSSPALNAVEHPIYDIWLLRCINKPAEEGARILVGEELMARDKLPKYTTKAPDDKKFLPIEEKAEVVVGSGLNPAVVEGEVVLDNDVTPIVETIRIDAGNTMPEPEAEPGVPSSLIRIPPQTPAVTPPEEPAQPEIIEAVEDASAMDVEEDDIEVISIDANEEARLKALEEERAAQAAIEAALTEAASFEKSSSSPVVPRVIPIGDYDEETNTGIGN